ncbi:MarR family winged helix-turn-helix transcriptional regulator [Slackia exigua]|uniref:MarR family winged helix-turn-helix transcriptional regulator n=1 Tax=Slackia exigua TaxID=84109 RepID=UPI0028EC7EC1|nr:MarR family transcriptional regulator [Slackia exigua]
MELHTAEQEHRALVNDLLTSTFNSIMSIEERSIELRLTAGLTMSELHTLVAVGMYDKTPVTVVAQRLSVTAATVTAAVNRLVRKGYVERVPSQEDRRKVLLHLTKSGRKAVRAHDLFHARMIDSILDGMDADEEAALLRSVRRIKEFFDKENEMLRTAPAAHRVDAADVAC